MLHLERKRRQKEHIRGMSLFGLTVFFILFLSGLAGTQEKQEPVIIGIKGQIRSQSPGPG